MDYLTIAGAVLLGVSFAVLVFKVESLEKRVDAIEKENRRYMGPG